MSISSDFLSVFGDVFQRTPVVHSFTISASATVALVLLFLPKVYIIIFRPEKNDRSAFTTTRDVRCHIGRAAGLQHSFSTSGESFDRSVANGLLAASCFVTGWAWLTVCFPTQLFNSKCLPVLLYGPEACSLSKSDLCSIDFALNRFFMKLFRTNNIETVKVCQFFFGISLPSVVLRSRTDKFEQKFSLCAEW